MPIIGSFSPITEGTGTGSPEGKVAAPVGSVYTDTAATNGAVRWIKTSGTGNTGWRVEYGDTGLRLLTTDAIATGQIFFRRRNDQCDLYFKSCAFNTISANRISIPQTQSDSAVAFPVYSGRSSRQSSLVMTMTLEPTDIGHAMQPVEADVAFDARVSWSTVSNWPTTLPGTPA